MCRYKCGPERVYNTPGAKRSKPRDSLPSLPSLEPRIASKATSRAASPEPSEGEPGQECSSASQVVQRARNRTWERASASLPHLEKRKGAVGQFRQVVQSLSSISSVPWTEADSTRRDLSDGDVHEDDAAPTPSEL